MIVSGLNIFVHWIGREEENIAIYWCLLRNEKRSSSFKLLLFPIDERKGK